MQVRNMEPSKKENRNTIILLVVISLLVIAYTLMIYSPRKVIMNVDSAYWRSQVNVKQYVKKTKADTYLPVGATLIKEENEICGYESVLSHYNDVEKTKKVSDGLEEQVIEVKNDNGTVELSTITVPKYREITYTEKEPVYVRVPRYAKKYYYEVGEWSIVRSVVEEGTDTKPHYGTLNLQPNESIANQYYGYYVTGQSMAKEYYLGDEVTVKRELRISADDMGKIQPGQTLELFVIGNTVLSWKEVANI